MTRRHRLRLTALTAALVVFGVGCAGGGAAIVPVINGGLAALACGWQVYTTDTAKTPPDAWTQIALDLATTCGMDVADIISLFGTQHPVTLAAQAHPDAVHQAASATRAKAGH
jgi:hypothetical protein